MLDFALQMLDFALQMMDYVLKMMGYVLKLMGYVLQRSSWQGCANTTRALPLPVILILKMMNFTLKDEFTTNDDGCLIENDGFLN